MASVVLLHTNDLHGVLDEAREARLAELRLKAHLYFDCGDAIRTGNLDIPLEEEPVWARFRRLALSAMVIGNRETHLGESGFKAKLAGAPTPVLCANLRLKSGARPLPGYVTLETQGLRVGVFGVSVPMVTDRMAARAISAYLWDPPVEIARDCVQRLRPEVDLLVGLTHIGHRLDLELVAAVPGIDVLLTGHSHTVLETPIEVGGTWICQGGSHGRYAGLYRWEAGKLSGRLQPLI